MPRKLGTLRRSFNLFYNMGDDVGLFSVVLTGVPIHRTLSRYLASFYMVLIQLIQAQGYLEVSQKKDKF